MSQTLKTYLTLSLIAVIGLAIFGYFFLGGVFGGTTFGVSLKTQTDLEEGLVGHWTFDGEDLIENAVDRSGQGNTGYLTGFTSTSTAAGVIGQALDFDGVNDYVATNNPDSNQLTISVWVNWDDTSANTNDGIGQGQPSGSTPTSVSNDKSVAMWVRVSDGRIGGRIVQPDSTERTLGAGANLVAGTWTHLVYRANGSLYELFVDAVAKVSISYDGTIKSRDPFFIGVQGSEEWKGIIDDFRIYNRALSADEITRLYDLGATTKIGKTIKTQTDLEDGLVGHWTFDGNDLINNVVDRSGQGNTGYLINFTSTTTAIGKIGQAIEFDGVNDYTSFTNYPPANFPIETDGITISVWYKGTDNSSRTGVAVQAYGNHTWGSYGLFLVSGDARMSAFSASNVVYRQPLSTTAVNDNNWRHLVGSIDPIGNLITIYVDGVLENTDIWIDTDALQTNTSQYQRFSVASNDKSASTGDFLSGIIDDVRIYNRVLSADEITRLYDLGATTKIGKTIKTQTDLEDGLVGHWTFDGPDLIENAVDRSGQGNTGYLTNFTSTTTVPGKIGQALDFDGVNDQVYLGSNLTFSSGEPFTMSAWAYMRDIDSQFVLSIGAAVTNEGPHLGSMSNGVWRFAIAGDGITDSTISHNINEWHFLTGTYDGTNGRLFIDGKLVEGPTAFTFTGTDGTGRIGTYGNGFFPWNGLIDDVRVYNRALSADEVKRLYDLGR